MVEIFCKKLVLWNVIQKQNDSLPFSFSEAEEFKDYKDVAKIRLNINLACFMFYHVYSFIKLLVL